MTTKNDCNGRTHEPSLRELTGQLDDLKELVDVKFGAVEKIMDERHDLYKERADNQKTAVDDALAAAKEQTSASFVASEKAIVKAEESQKSYNQGHNDLSRKMEQQYATMVPQAEAKLKWDSIDKAIEENRKEVSSAKTEGREQVNGLRMEIMREIASLRESRSGGEGKDKAHEADRKMSSAVITLTITSVISVLGIVVLLISILMHK